MDNNNLYEQGNQNTELGQQQPYNQGYNQGCQQPYQQQSYQQPYNQGYNQGCQQPYQQQSYQQDSELEEPVSFGDWMLSMLLMMIPCVNIIMMFVWAFSNGTKKSKSNYFKAVLVWTLIWIVLMILMMIGLGATMASIATYY